MNKKLKTAIKIILFIGFGIAIFMLVYKDFDFKNFANALSDIKWGWLIPASVISLLSHISRARRWQLMLETTGEKPNHDGAKYIIKNNGARRILESVNLLANVIQSIYYLF